MKRVCPEPEAAAAGDGSELSSRLKRLPGASLISVLHQLLQEGAVTPDVLSAVVHKQEELIGSAGGAGSSGGDGGSSEACKQRAAVQRLTDPALISSWFARMAGKLEREIRADWHDGYEEQGATMSCMMGDAQMMAAAASLAYTSGSYNTAIEACSGIAAGLGRLCKVFDRSRNDTATTLDPCCEHMVFPLDPVGCQPKYTPSVLRKEVLSSFQAAEALWAAGLGDKDCAEESYACTGCIFKTLACIWLAAVLELVAAADGPGERQDAASRLGPLVRVVASCSKWAPKLEVRRGQAHPLLRLTEELGYGQQRECLQAVREAVGAPPGDGAGPVAQQATPPPPSGGTKDTYVPSEYARRMQECMEQSIKRTINGAKQKAASRALEKRTAAAAQREHHHHHQQQQQPGMAADITN